jgi:hypothetical protein
MTAVSKIVTYPKIATGSAAWEYRGKDLHTGGKRLIPSPIRIDPRAIAALRRGRGGTSPSPSTAASATEANEERARIPAPSKRIPEAWITAATGQRVIGIAVVSGASEQSGRVAHPFAFLSVDERARLDDTTPVRQRRGTGSVFPGGRPFRF